MMQPGKDSGGFRATNPVHWIVKGLFSRNFERTDPSIPSRGERGCKDTGISVISPVREPNREEMEIEKRSTR